MGRRIASRFVASAEPLEERLCMASSVGWDGPGQGSARLSYYIGNVPSSLGSAAEAAIETALNVWASVADITFTQTTSPGQSDSIDFSFARIDGRNGILAEAYYPDDVNPARVAGDVQFDSAERWEVGNGRGSSAFDLVLTVVHEIGHALGLDHSGVPGSVMAASISARQSFTGLSSGDVNAIHQLYAPAETSASKPTTPTTSTETTPGTPQTPTDTEPLPYSMPPFRFRRFWWRLNRRTGSQAS